MTKHTLDVVILQEQSERPASAPGKFYDGVRAMGEKLSEETQVLLYRTWGRKEPHATLTSHGWTNEIMARKLAAAYEAIGDEWAMPFRR